MSSSSESIAIGGASANPFTASKDHISEPSSISNPLNSAPSTLVEPSASVGIEIIISGVVSESRLAITGPGNLM